MSPTTDFPATKKGLESLRARLGDVSARRDLWTATERSAEVSSVVSAFDRQSSQFSSTQLAALNIARAHMRAMRDCPKRIRLDDTWPDDLVLEATQTVDALLTLLALAE